MRPTEATKKSIIKQKTFQFRHRTLMTCIFCFVAPVLLQVRRHKWKASFQQNLTYPFHYKITVKNLWYWQAGVRVTILCFRQCTFSKRRCASWRTRKPTCPIWLYGDIFYSSTFFNKPLEKYFTQIWNSVFLPKNSMTYDYGRKNWISSEKSPLTSILFDKELIVVCLGPGWLESGQPFRLLWPSPEVY